MIASTNQRIPKKAIFFQIVLLAYFGALFGLTLSSLPFKGSVSLAEFASSSGVSGSPAFLGMAWAFVLCFGMEDGFDAIAVATIVVSLWLFIDTVRELLRFKEPTYFAKLNILLPLLLLRTIPDAQLAMKGSNDPLIFILSILLRLGVIAIYVWGYVGDIRRSAPERRIEVFAHSMRLSAAFLIGLALLYFASGLCLFFFESYCHPLYPQAQPVIDGFLLRLEGVIHAYPRRGGLPYAGMLFGLFLLSYAYLLPLYRHFLGKFGATLIEEKSNQAQK